MIKRQIRLGAYVISSLTLFSCTTEISTLEDFSIIATDATASIAENPESGDEITTLYALDNDPDNTPTYTLLSESVSGALAIDGDKLVVADASAFDYETNPEITGEFQAITADGVTSSATFTIALENIIEADGAFVTRWETTADGEEITIYTHANDDDEIYYNYDIDWGDGNVETGVTGDIAHTYETAGAYEVSITGELFPGIKQGNETNAQKLKAVVLWGENEWTQLNSAFRYCDNLVIEDLSSPNLSKAESLSLMFMDTDSFDADLSHWDVSNITGFSNMFRTAKSFNGDISGWDVSNGENFHAMFLGATAFDQPLNNWDMSSATDISNMFTGALLFNQDLNDWDTSNVTNMNAIFQNASVFNGNIADWDTSAVLQMRYLFASAIAFNQDISGWDMSSMISLEKAFASARAFNQDISGWNTGNIISMYATFQGAIAFDQDISGWDVSNVVNCSLFASGVTTDNLVTPTFPEGCE